MDFKVKSSIAVDVATHVFNFYLPLTPMITNIIEKSKNPDIVGAWKRTMFVPIQRLVLTQPIEWRQQLDDDDIGPIL